MKDILNILEILIQEKERLNQEQFERLFLELEIPEWRDDDEEEHPESSIIIIDI